MSLIQTANNIHDATPWLQFIELGIPEIPPVRIVLNNENINWKGSEWFALGLDGVDAQIGRGEVPSLDLKLPNAGRIISKYLRDYHEYLKTNGFEGNEIPVTFYIVPYKLILADENCDAAQSFTVEYMSAKIQGGDATLTLGGLNIFNMYFPNLTISPSCNWEFKKEICAYAGTETSCNKTLRRCRELGNSARFGGHMGVLPLGVQIATS